jgi:hypothetical protein
VLPKIISNSSLAEKCCPIFIKHTLKSPKIVIIRILILVEREE